MIPMIPKDYRIKPSKIDLVTNIVIVGLKSLKPMQKKHSWGL